MRVKGLIWILLIIVVLFLVRHFFLTPSDIPSAPAGQQPVPVEVTVVQETEFTEEVSSTGSLLAQEEVTLRSEAAGRIVEIGFREGAPVVQGQLMVRLFSDDLKAQLKKTKASLRLAEDRITRNQKLVNMQGISREEFDRMLNEAELLRAEEEIIIAQMSKTEIRAPFSGMAGLREVSIGAIVQPQQTITTVQRLEPLKLEFTLPEQFIGRISPGDSLNFSVAGQVAGRRAVVYATDPLVSQSSRSMRVRATCIGSANGLLPGAFAKISIPMKHIRSLLVPAESVVPVLKGKQVYVVRNGIADTTGIRTGVRTARSIEVLDGLNPGDSIVTSGLLQLRPGSPVRVKSKTP